MDWDTNHQGYRRPDIATNGGFDFNQLISMFNNHERLDNMGYRRKDTSYVTPHYAPR
jgi:hypothetical protein